MKVDLQEAAKRLNFNEQALLDTAHILLDAKENRRNIFSEIPHACDYILPDGMKRGSPEHGVYLMYMTILDVQMNSDSLHSKARELYAKMPEFYDPKEMFEADKDKLKIIELVGKKKEKKESDVAPVPEDAFRESHVDGEEEAYEGYLSENGNGDSAEGKRRRPMKIVVAPTIAKILKKELGCGFYYQLSNRIYQTDRKLAMRYDCDPTNILKHVKDYDVALSRLDISKSKPDKSRERRNETFPRFAGLGPAKTGPLLIHKFIKEGFAKDLDRMHVPVPIDRWEINCSIKRGITDIEMDMRKDDYIRDLQALYHDAFIRANPQIDPIKFHHNLWLLGSEVCVYTNCDTRKTSDEKDMMCPFLSVQNSEESSVVDPCKKFLDIDAYRRRGIIKVSYFKME